MEVTKVSTANAINAMNNAAEGKDELGGGSPFSALFGDLMASSTLNMGFDVSKTFAANSDKPRIDEPRAPRQTDRNDAATRDDAPKADRRDRADARDADDAAARTDTADTDDRAAQRSTRDDRADAQGDRTDTHGSRDQTRAGKTDDGGNDDGQMQSTAPAEVPVADQSNETTVAVSVLNAGLPAAPVADDAAAKRAGGEALAKTGPVQGAAEAGTEKVAAGPRGGTQDAPSQRNDSAAGPDAHAAQGLARADAKAADGAQVHTLSAAAQKAAEAENAALDALRQQQQADLAKRIEGDHPATVKVAVKTKGADVALQTPAALTAAVVASEAEAQVGRPATDTRPQPATAQSQAANAAVQAAQTQAQAQGDAQLGANPQVIAAQAAAAAAATATRATGETTTPTAPAPVGDVQAAGAAQPASQAAQTAEARPAAAAQHARPAAMPQQAMQQISVNISKAISQGMDRISIQLRPAELGRVEVQLDISHAGRVSAHVIVDRQETLDMLRNDARGLEKALQDAGLDTNAGDLNFSLRGENQERAEREARARAEGLDRAQADRDLEEQIQALTSPDYSGRAVADGRIDIRA